MFDCEINGTGAAGEPADAESCFARGILVSSGREAEIDMIEAHKWFNIAAARGHAEGAQMRREVAAQMSDAEIGRAQRAARDWLKAHPLPQMVELVIRAAA
jgi:uncharacterized protein